MIFFVLVFQFGLQVRIVMAMVDNENYNCIEVALFQVACSTNVIKQGSKKISKSRSHLTTLGARSVTGSQFHTEDPPVFGTTI
jgi:hypothetical protein